MKGSNKFSVSQVSLQLLFVPFVPKNHCMVILAGNSIGMLTKLSQTIFSRVLSCLNSLTVVGVHKPLDPSTIDG